MGVRDGSQILSNFFDHTMTEKIVGYTNTFILQHLVINFYTLIGGTPYGGTPTIRNIKHQIFSILFRAGPFDLLTTSP